MTIKCLSDDPKKAVDDFKDALYYIEMLMRSTQVNSVPSGLCGSQRPIKLNSEVKSNG